MYENSNLSTFSLSFIFLFFFFNAHPSEYGIFISLRTNDVEHHFMYLLTIHTSSVENFLFILCPFLIRLSCYYWVLEVHCRFWTPDPYQIYITCKYFLPFYRLSFSLTLSFDAEKNLILKNSNLSFISFGGLCSPVCGTRWGCPDLSFVVCIFGVIVYEIIP